MEEDKPIENGKKLGNEEEIKQNEKIANTSNKSQVYNILSLQNSFIIMFEEQTRERNKTLQITL